VNNCDHLLYRIIYPCQSSIQNNLSLTDIQQTYGAAPAFHHLVPLVLVCFYSSARNRKRTLGLALQHIS